MYTFTSRVIRGKGRGRTFGFPTANFSSPHASRILPAGIFSAWAFTGRRWYPAAVSVGKNKTFHARHATIEAHLIGFHGTLYGRRITLVFVQRLRAMRKFLSVSALVRQMKNDITASRDTLVPSY